MAIQAIKKIRVGDQVHAQLVEQLLRGAWKPGDRLPSENGLALMFGVSRVTVRQALQKMVAQGLVETRQGDGTFVRSYAPALSMNNVMPAAVLSDNSLADALEFRRIIEAPTAALAVKKATDEDIRRLGDIYDRMLACDRTAAAEAGVMGARAEAGGAAGGRERAGAGGAATAEAGATGERAGASAAGGAAPALGEWPAALVAEAGATYISAAGATSATIAETDSEARLAGAAAEAGATGAPEYDQSFYVADFEFHMYFAQMTRNMLLVETYRALRDVFLSAMKEIVGARGRSHGIYYHGLLLDATRARDAALCEKLMAEHIDNTCEDMLACAKRRQP
ncbi:MAG: GntR family transcriptional regulator [Clostridiales bacterium]|nr:GntR family transcriptional regulator [Clostridiales bacterium]